LRIIFQILSFISISFLFVFLSFPFGYFDSFEKIFLTSPSLVLFAAISSLSVFLPHLLFAAVFMLAAFLFGRIFCGWICPFGAVMDFAAFILKPFRKWKESEPSKRLLSKYILLFVFAALSIFGLQIVWHFEPITIFARFFNLSLFPFLNALLDKVFQYFIINHNIGAQLYSVISDNIFAAKQISFHYSLFFFLCFAIPLLLIVYKRRFWCRYICPLGAALGILSFKSPFGLKSKPCLNSCGRCRDICPSNAMRTDGSFIKSECIMCMECYGLKCKKAIAEVLPSQKESAQKVISRKQFLLWGAGIASALIVIGREKLSFFSAGRSSRINLLRPPGAVCNGNSFKQLCVRCGNCMKVCPTNALQPAGLESGFDGIWTPKLDASIGYCEYECNACGPICPTQAVRQMSLEDKKNFTIGKAEIQREICLPWSQGIPCLVCEEMCPIPQKAIEFLPETIKGVRIDVPFVKRELCIGCSICQNKCPVEGINKGIDVKAIFS
jgi:polyferredoxin